MAQKLRALVVLAEDLARIPSIHKAAHNHPQLQSQGTCPILASVVTRQAHEAQTQMQAKHLYTERENKEV